MIKSKTAVMIKPLFSIITMVGLVYLGFWYWHSFAYQWYTVPVELSFAGGWFIVWGVLFR